MTKFRISILLVSFLLLGYSCKTHQPVRVYPVNHLEAGHSRQGFYYALPRTVVTIDIMVLKTEDIPGPFARYAGSFLGLDEVITTPSVRYSFYNVAINSYAESDPGSFYFVEYDVKNNRNNPFSISLSESGLITGINLIPEKDDSNGIRKTVSGFGNYGSKATFNHFMETNLQEKIDTIIERVRMDTVTIERKTLRRTWVEKTSEVRAREVADYILKIRNKRFDLVSGFAEITYSRDAIKYMNEQMETLENDYLELFTGITTQSIIRYRYYYIPEKNSAGDSVTLFHFSESNGITENPRAGSQEVKISVARDFSTRQMGIFTMNPTGKKEVDRGIYYRIPEYGNIRISNGDAPLADSRLLISQFGAITSLPPDDFSIEFYPETGTIRSVERIR